MKTNFKIIFILHNTCCFYTTEPSHNESYIYQSAVYKWYRCGTVLEKTDFRFNPRDSHRPGGYFGLPLQHETLDVAVKSECSFSRLTCLNRETPRPSSQAHRRRCHGWALPRVLQVQATRVRVPAGPPAGLRGGGRACMGER